MDENSRPRYQERNLNPGNFRLLPPAGEYTEAAPEANLFDFRAVWQLLRRRFWFIAVVTMVCIGVTVFLNSLNAPTYTATTRILLDEQNVNPFGNDEIFSDLRLTNPIVESQMQLMRSPYLLSQVVAGLGLDTDEAFMTPQVTETRAQIDALLASILPQDQEQEAPPTEAERFEAAVDSLRSNLRISRNAQTLVIRIDFTTTDRELAARVVNAVADTYLANRLAIRQDTATDAGAWFDERIAELNARALDAEQQIERLSRGGEEALNASAVAADLQSARQTLQGAMTERSQARADAVRLQVIVDSGRGLRGVPSAMATGPLGILVDEAAERRRALAEALQTEGASDEEIEALRIGVEAIEADGLGLLAEMLQDAEARVTEAEAAEVAAQEAFSTARNAGNGNVANAIEVELRTLEGEARVYRELHESYLESYLRTIQQQSFPSTEATIIDIALPPEFSDGPGLSRLGMLAMLIGVTLGAAGAFLVEQSDGRVRTKGQLQKATGVPVLGLLPLHAEEPGKSRGGRKAPLHLPTIRQPNRSRETGHEVIALPENRVAITQDAPQLYAVIADPLSQYAGSIRRVSVEVANAEAAVNHEFHSTKITAFISDKESRGRSIAALNYAEMLAVGGSRTLLIDLDWTGVFLTEKITPAAQAGITDLLMPDETTHSEQAFWYDERTSLYLLPNRPLASEVALDPGVFDPVRLMHVLNAVSVEFDDIVLDLSPLSRAPDAASLSQIVSGYVVVADWGQTQAASLEAELKRAGIRRPKLLGTLLNGVSSKELGRFDSAA